jgi:aspartate/glutamate racemase
MELRSGLAVEGYVVGVLHLESRYPLPPGNAQHAQTYPFPVAFEAVPVTDPLALMRGEPSIEPLLIAACERLVRRGVRVIVGACGSFAYYQKAVAETASVPVFCSVLTQVPLILQSLGRKRLGVICASDSSMNQRIYAACDVADPSRLAIAQMKGHSEFDRMLTQREPMEEARLREQTVAVAEQLARTHSDIGALLLQCSDLPPYAAAIQEATDLPVFDAVSLVHWAQHAAYSPTYQGLRRRYHRS